MSTDNKSLKQIMGFRLEKLNKTNVCVLCADQANDYSKFHDRIKNPTPTCPICNSETVLFTNHEDNSKKIYCSRFSFRSLTSSLCKSLDP